jgi:hypothetical protein
VDLSVAAPSDGATIRGKSVVVRGRVSPANAELDINGEDITARNGRFAHRVPLDLGENNIVVFSTSPGHEGSETSISVTRERTSQELADLRERRRQRRIEREQRRQEKIAAQTQTFSGNGSKNIGSIEVETDSVLEWTNSGDPAFQQILIYDADFGLNVSSDAGSGDTVVPAGSYSNITVAGDSWTLTIRPR